MKQQINSSELVSYYLPCDRQSSLFSLQVNQTNVPVTEFPDIEIEDYERIASEYRKLSSVCWVESRFIGVHYAHLACTGQVEIKVCAPEIIDFVSISPKRKNISSTVNDRDLRFQVDVKSPVYLIIAINELPLLCVLIDPLEVDVPDVDDETVVNANLFLTDTTGSVDQTEAFEEAIGFVNASGKTLLIPAGVYLTDTIKISKMRNFKVYFSPGSLIRVKISPPGANLHSHGIWIDESDGITIFGSGIIDHMAYENFKAGRNNFKDGLISWSVSNDSCPYTTMSPLFISRSQNIRIERLTVRNSRNFNYNVRGSDNVYFRYCKAITPPACIPEYTDGFNINSCQGFLLEDCFVFCNDDCFASGHYFYSFDDRESKNHVIKGLVGWNPRANGIRLGFWSHFDMGDMFFEDCDFIGADDSAVIIHALQDSPEAERFQRYGTIRFENCGFDDADRMEYGLILVNQPRIKSLQFKNVIFDSNAPQPSWIEGHPQDKIDELMIEKLKIGNNVISELGQGNIEIKNISKFSIKE